MNRLYAPVYEGPSLGWLKGKRDNLPTIFLFWNTHYYVDQWGYHFSGTYKYWEEVN
jgi:hypothetical protein